MSATFERWSDDDGVRYRLETEDGPIRNLVIKEARYLVDSVPEQSVRVFREDTGEEIDPRAL